MIHKTMLPRILSMRFHNDSIFMKLCKSTETDNDERFIILPELYDVNNNILTENLLIMSIRRELR